MNKKMNKRRPAGETVRAFEKEMRRQAEEISFQELFLLLILQLCEDFHENPQIYFEKEKRGLWILFPDVRMDTEAFAEAYGLETAQLSMQGDVSILGMSGEMDLGEMDIRFQDEDSLLITRQNSVGSRFQEIDGVGLSVILPKDLDYDAYRQVLEHLDYQKSCISIEKNLERVFDKMEAFPVLKQDTYYGYIKTRECTELLFPEMLSMEQKKRLWLVFLEKGLSPLEFGFVNEALSLGMEISVFSWAIALEMAMEEARITIEYTNKEFHIQDESGRRRWYSHQSVLEAEKLFMKLLFPAVPLDSLR